MLPIPIPIPTILSQDVAPLTVDSAVQAAMLHNPRVLAATKEAIAARFGIRSARALATISPALGPINGTGAGSFRPRDGGGARGHHPGQGSLCRARGIFVIPIEIIIRIRTGERS